MTSQIADELKIGEFQIHIGVTDEPNRLHIEERE